MRRIALDTETTGLSPKDGHRVVEIGCVELDGNIPTGNEWHSYVNPDRAMPEAAFAVHGLSEEFLKKEPRFRDIAEDFLRFIKGGELVIHNAKFDIGFLNSELKAVSAKYPKLEDICEIEDSLVIARNKFPGQRNSLDALANRFEVSGYDRSFHGALLDANILADVYIYLTGGQSKFEFSDNTLSASESSREMQSSASLEGLKFVKVSASKSDIKAHQKRLEEIKEKNNIETIWNNYL